MAKAAKLLEATLQWRLTVQLDQLRFADVAAEAATGKMQRLPIYDSAGRPVLLMRPGLENTRAAAGQLRFLQWTMEDVARARAAAPRRALRHLTCAARRAAQVRSMSSGHGGFPRGAAADLAPEQMTILIDFSGYR